MKDEKIIELLLGTNQSTDNSTRRESTIIACLKSARFLCSNSLLRNDYSNNKITEFVFEKGLYHSNLLAGIVSYLIFLDQVGCVFKPKNALKNIKSSTNKGSELHKALKYFSTLNGAQIQIIRALRNSLLHQFSLATDKHKFVLSIENSPIIIKMPTIKWEGKFNEEREENETTIYISKLIELVESVFQKLLEEKANNNLDLVIHNHNELLAKYTIT